MEVQSHPQLGQLRKQLGKAWQGIARHSKAARRLLTRDVFHPDLSNGRKRQDQVKVLASKLLQSLQS